MKIYTLSANTSRTIPKAFRDTAISQLFSSLRNNKLDIGFFTATMDILGFTIGPLCLGPLSEVSSLSSLPINFRSVLTTARPATSQFAALWFWKPCLGCHLPGYCTYRSRLA